MLQHILFDLDHTLWDFDSNSHLTKLEMYDYYDLDSIFSSFNDFETIYTFHNTHLWKEYAAGRTNKQNVSVGRFYYPMLEKGLDDYNKAQQMADFYLYKTAQRTQLMPNALDTLKYLSNKYQLHIITNGFVEVQYKKVELSGIGKYVKEVFISDEIGAMKPSKEFFDTVLRKLNTTAESCLIVGDSPESDIVGGINNNIEAIYYNSRNVVCPYNVKTINNLAELTSIL